MAPTLRIPMYHILSLSLLSSSLLSLLLLFLFSSLVLIRQLWKCGSAVSGHLKQNPSGSRHYSDCQASARLEGHAGKHLG